MEETKDIVVEGKTLKCGELANAGRQCRQLVHVQRQAFERVQLSETWREGGELIGIDPQGSEGGASVNSCRD